MLFRTNGTGVRRTTDIIGRIVKTVQKRTKRGREGEERVANVLARRNPETLQFYDSLHALKNIISVWDCFKEKEIGR